MISVAEQLKMVAENVARLDAQRRAAEVERQVKTERERQARQKQWATRKGEPNQLRNVLLERLPRGKDLAIPVAGVMALFSDYDFAPTGISSALSILCKAGLIQRLGERFSYRYYVNS